MADKGLNCPNRQWGLWTTDEVAAIRDLAPDVLLVLAYGDDSPVAAQTAQHLALADELRARLQVRVYATDIPRRDPEEWAAECWRWASRYGDHRLEVIPANEMNLPSEGLEVGGWGSGEPAPDWQRLGEWLKRWAVAYRRLASAGSGGYHLLHLPALAPGPLTADASDRAAGLEAAWQVFRRLRLAELFDVVDVHEYPGSFRSHLAAYSMFGRPVSVTEFNQVDPGDYLRSLPWTVADASWFILSGTDDHRQHWLISRPEWYASFKTFTNPHGVTGRYSKKWGGMFFGGVYVTDRRGELAARAGQEVEAVRDPPLLNEARAPAPSLSRGYRWRELAEIEQVILHHTAGANRDFSAAEIADYHVKTQGWPGIGYHFLIHPDGRVDYVGDIATVRYHVGDLNAGSIGICLAGDFSRERPTATALARARQLIQKGIWPVLGRRVPVRGHVEVWRQANRGPTSCPGDTFWQWRREVIG
ncbi:MAG: peptidoglycan recognition protein family protein [Chloroflexota bacterium]